MFTIEGTHGTAACYATNIEDTCVEQIRTMLGMPFAEGANTAIMPDAHFGIGCTAQSAPPSYQPPTRGRYLVSRCSSNPHRETSYNAASPFLAAQESPVQRNP